jgi:PAS domain-containing protein
MVRAYDAGDFVVPTRFAPAERQSREDLREESENLRFLRYLRELFDALPFVASVLNQERQIVYTNEALLRMLGLSSLEDIVGRRPGEALACIHADELPGGCGTTESCSVCGAVKTTLKCQETGRREEDECRISSFLGGRPTSFDLRISATPIKILRRMYTLFTAIDVGDEKRRRALERIFFHDLMNIAGGLRGYLELLERTTDPDRTKAMVAGSLRAADRLIGEIAAQRQLMAAEKGDLAVKVSAVQTKELIEGIVDALGVRGSAGEQSIVFAPESDHCVLQTDESLLARVIINMLKNALEASNHYDPVAIGVTRGPAAATIWVRNAGVMPLAVRLQVFQRSFSTKGGSRGLGTYSMKLLGEKYLRGKVWFTSDEAQGTTFHVSVPLALR